MTLKQCSSWFLEGLRWICAKVQIIYTGKLKTQEWTSARFDLSDIHEPSYRDKAYAVTSRYVIAMRNASLTHD